MTDIEDIEKPGAPITLKRAGFPAPFDTPANSLLFEIEVLESCFSDVPDKLTASGFSLVVGGDGHTEIVHKFDHCDGWHVDVMVEDFHGPFSSQGQVLVHSPGSKSALGVYSDGEGKELLEVFTASGAPALIPNVWSTIALNGHALRQPTADPQRHVSDGLALLACSGRYEPSDSTNSEREGVNFIVSSSYFSDLGSWAMLENASEHTVIMEVIESYRDIHDVLPPAALFY